MEFETFAEKFEKLISNMNEAVTDGDAITYFTGLDFQEQWAMSQLYDLCVNYQTLANTIWDKVNKDY